jgi:alpha-D-xyloside xylohydrolase
MFGSAIMVAPVYKYKARSREVYFPSSSGWYDFYTGIYIKGGQRQNMDAPYERIPLYIKEGTILPVGPEIQYTTEKQADPLTVFVYSGKDCGFTLYEDEGSNYNYEKGMYSNIRFDYNESKKELIINERKGVFSGMLKSRTFNIVFIDKNKPVPFDANVKPDKVISYNGDKVAISRQ